MKRWQVIALLAGLLESCGQADVPEVYHGHVGSVALAIPSRIASSVLYDGESDWKAPDRPKSERTERDAVNEVEFFVDLDHPTQLQEYNYANRVRFVDHPSVRRPAVSGHLLGVTALLGQEWKERPELIRAGYQGVRFRGMRPSPPIYGLEARHQDYSAAVSGVQRHGLSEVDADYLSSPDGVYIQCNDARASVAPFDPMPTCHIWVIDQMIGARLMTDFDRGDLPRWRELKAAMLNTLYSFRGAAKS